MSAEARVYSERKQAFKAQVEEYLDTYNKAIVVNADNVGSNQMHQIRRALRGKAYLVMGKNTLCRYIINTHCVTRDTKKWANLAGCCRYNIGLVFTNDDLKQVRDLLLDNRVEAAARVGALAPLDVSIFAGPTGLEPTQTSFFQALQIQTKINKGSIDIMSDQLLVKAGEKVGASEVALLNKLGIKPFSYGLEISKIWEDGALYPAAVLDISEDDIKGVIQHCLTRIAAFSLATGYATAAAIPHLIVNAFKNCVAVTLDTEVTFEQAEKVKAAMAAGPAVAAPAAGGGGGAAAKAPEPEPEEEDDGDMGFSLFD